MSRGSSNNFLNVVNADQPNDIFIHLVTVFWPDNSVDRYAKNYEPVTSRTNTYDASAFEINLPEEPTDSVPTIRMDFTASDRTVLRKLVEATESPLVRLEVVLASDTDIVEMGPFDFDVKEFQIQGPAVSVELGFEPILDLAIPQISYTPTLFPGLYSNVTAND